MALASSHDRDQTLDGVLEQLGSEYHRDGKGTLYDRLKVALVGAPGAAPYAQIGRELGMSEAAVKKAAPTKKPAKKG